MKTKYVCRGLISLYVNFHNNRTMWSTNLIVKICRWGQKEKEPFSLQNLRKIIIRVILTWRIKAKNFVKIVSETIY